MVCIPSSRISIINWIERRGYIKTGAHPYPSKQLDHEVVIENLQLIVYLKPLNNEDDNLADTKEKKEKPILTLNNKVSDATVFINNDINDMDNTNNVPPQVPGKMNLPPHWRMSNLQINNEIESDADSKSKPHIPDVD